MKKSFISILLAIVMVSVSCMPAFGTETGTGEEAVVTESSTEEEASENKEAVVEETLSDEAESGKESVTEEAAPEENETEESEAEAENTGAEAEAENTGAEIEAENVDAEAEADEDAVQETGSVEEDVVEETESDDAATAEEDASVDSVTEESETANTETGAAVSEEELTVEAASDAVQKEAVAAGADADEGVVITVTEDESERYYPEDDISCDEMFAAYVDDAFGITEFSDGKLKGKTVKAGSKLTGFDLAIYNYIGGQLGSIADGKQTSTIFELSTDDLGYDGSLWTAEDLGVDRIVENGGITEEAVKAIYDASKILDALLADYPYLLYWFNKTKTGGLTPYVPVKANTFDGVYKCWIEGTSTFKFAVSTEFALSGETYEVDPSTGTAVQTAVANATSIVSKYSSKQDFDKLKAYCDEICDLTSYHSAAGHNNYTYNYGNPWQLIWVFDGDADTEVVCEGYSKAFKYLCDKTEFSADIGCTTVTGSIPQGGHMWNIVNMDDDCNYLVDVTNVDSYSKENYEYGLFLAGTEGSVDSGYTFCGNKYVYDEEMTELWDTEDLTLKVHNYGEHVASSEWTVTKEPTCTEKGSRQKVCTLCGDVLETEEIDLIDHTWKTEYTVDVEPTFTSEGSMSFHCAVCGAIDEETVKTIPDLKEGWYEEETGWRYYYDDGTYPTNSFVSIENKVYYFGESGYRVTGWQTIGGSKYYFNTSGVMQTGWQTISGSRYYFNTSGVMQKGWQTIGGKKYYFNTSGQMQTGWQTIGGSKYYFKQTGVMHIGWLKYGGYYYYFKTNGVMLTGWLKKAGKMYYFKTNGQRLSGWLKRSGKYFYFKLNGEMLTGWLKKSGKYYYFRTNGERLTGWLKRGGKYYYFKPSNGQMVTGRYKIGSNWFTFDSNGVRQ